MTILLFVICLKFKLFGNRKCMNPVQIINILIVANYNNFKKFGGGNN